MTGPEVLFAKAALWLLTALGTLVAVMAGATRWATGHTSGRTRQDRTSTAAADPVSGVCPYCIGHVHHLSDGVCKRKITTPGGAASVGCGCDGKPRPVEDTAEDMLASLAADPDRTRNRTSDRTSGRHDTTVDQDISRRHDTTSARTSKATSSRTSRATSSARKDRT